MSGASVSIVIPSWNGRRYLGPCLDAVLAQEPPGFEVVVVDNASGDGSADWVAATYPQVHLVRNGDNLGFAGACNVGIRRARGQVLVLLNQDTRVQVGWLRALVHALEEPAVGIVGCKALYPDGKTIQHAGGWIEWPVGLAFHYGAGERDAGQWNVWRRVEYVTGAAMAFRRDVLDWIGALDEGFWPGYFEDADYCFRAREAGYEVWYVPNAVFLHEESAILAGTPRLSQTYHMGRLRFVLKHLPPARFLAEFAPAEQDVFLSSAEGGQALALRLAYTRAMVAAASLYPARWQADVGTIEAALRILQALYLFPIPGARSIEPSLSEYEFNSTVPVLGGLFAGIRSLWHNVAARWAVRHLTGQQEAINRQLKAAAERQQVINDLHVRSLVSLSRDVARLAMRLEAEHTGDAALSEGQQAP